MITQEYMDQVNAKKAEVSALTGLAWELEHTGGGCTALTAQLSNGCYWMITGYGLEAPTNDTDEIMLGMYEGDEDEARLFYDCVNLSECVDIVNGWEFGGVRPLFATCGHEDALGYLIGSPCEACVRKSHRKAVGRK